MPFDPILANRMRPMILGRAGASERNMFGGIGFFVFGNMCCGIWHDQLVLRLSPKEAQEVLKLPHTKLMDITGKPMKGWVMVEPEGFEQDEELIRWINRSYEFALSLPKKF